MGQLDLPPEGKADAAFVRTEAEQGPPQPGSPREVHDDGRPIAGPLELRRIVEDLHHEQCDLGPRVHPLPLDPGLERDALGREGRDDARDGLDPRRADAVEAIAGLGALEGRPLEGGEPTGKPQLPHVVDAGHETEPGGELEVDHVLPAGHNPPPQPVSAGGRDLGHVGSGVKGGLLPSREPDEVGAPIPRVRGEAGPGLERGDLTVQALELDPGPVGARSGESERAREPAGRGGEGDCEGDQGAGNPAVEPA